MIAKIELDKRIHDAETAAGKLALEGNEVMAESRHRQYERGIFVWYASYGELWMRKIQHSDYHGDVMGKLARWYAENDPNNLPPLIAKKYNLESGVMV